MKSSIIQNWIYLRCINLATIPVSRSPTISHAHTYYLPMIRTTWKLRKCLQGPPWKLCGQGVIYANWSALPRASRLTLADGFELPRATNKEVRVKNPQRQLPTTKTAPTSSLGHLSTIFSPTRWRNSFWFMRLKVRISWPLGLHIAAEYLYHQDRTLCITSMKHSWARLIFDRVRKHGSHWSSIHGLRRHESSSSSCWFDIVALIQRLGSDWIDKLLESWSTVLLIYFSQSFPALKCFPIWISEVWITIAWNKQSLHRWNSSNQMTGPLRKGLQRQIMACMSDLADVVPDIASSKSLCNAFCLRLAATYRTATPKPRMKYHLSSVLLKRGMSWPNSLHSYSY